MQFALWAYPWDLIDEGVESVAERCAEIGVDELNLATNYHAVQPFLPHNPERTTFFAHASSYFHPDESRYGRLSPIPNERMGDDDWLARISNEIADTPLSMNSWTIGCHNSRLGIANPDLTLKSPFGDSLAFGLCPSKPEVQEYLCSVLSDLSARAPFERIELETFDYFHGTGFGWHHDKYHIELGRLGEFLFGLCFCDKCCENARDAGVDVEAARSASTDAVDALAAGRFPADIDLVSWFNAHSEVAKYAAVRTDTLASLFRKFRASVDAKLGYYVGLLNVADTWMHGADLKKLAPHLDYFTVAAYESSPEAVLSEFQTARDLAPNAEMHAGILPGHPAVHHSETVAEIVDALAGAGVPRISFYNYSLLPERNLDWIADSTEPYR